MVHLFENDRQKPKIPPRNRWRLLHLYTLLATALLCVLLPHSGLANDKRPLTALAYEGFLPLPSLGIEADELMSLLLDIKTSLPGEVSNEQLKGAAKSVQDFYRAKGVEFVTVTVSPRLSSSGVVWLRVNDLRKAQPIEKALEAPLVTEPSAPEKPSAPAKPSVPIEATVGTGPVVKASPATRIKTETLAEPVIEEGQVTQTVREAQTKPIAEPTLEPIGKNRSLLSTPEEQAILPVDSTIDFGALNVATLGIEQERVSALIRQLKEGMGQYLSLEELYSIADELTVLIRQQGYKFHSVYVPVQRLRKGQPVRFELLAGTLGDVHVRGDEDALNERVRAIFDDLLGQVIYQPEIDQKILSLKRQFGLELVAYYSRGSGPSQARLNLKVARSRDWFAKMSVDNYGNESTGRERVLAIAGTHGLFGVFDSLSLGVQQAIDGERNTYGSLDYRTPLWSLGHELSFRASNNQFDLGGDFESLDLEGDARVLSAAYHFTAVESFTQTHRFALAYNDKSNDYDSPFNDPLLEQEEAAQSASLNWLWQYRPIASAWQYALSIGISNGKFDSSTSPFDESFTKLQFSQQLQWALGKLSSWGSLRWSLRGQYSEHNLSSFESFAMTGAFGVRGYATGYFSAERGALTSLEWRLPALDWLGQSLRLTPFLFSDAGYGERLGSNDLAESRAFLSGAGLGLDLELHGSWHLRLQGAGGLQEDVYENPDPDDLSLLFSLEYQWR